MRGDGVVDSRVTVRTSRGESAGGRLKNFPHHDVGSLVFFDGGQDAVVRIQGRAIAAGAGSVLYWRLVSSAIP